MTPSETRKRSDSCSQSAPSVRIRPTGRAIPEIAQGSRRLLAPSFAHGRGWVYPSRGRRASTPSRSRSCICRCGGFGTMAGLPLRGRDEAQVGEGPEDQSPGGFGGLAGVEVVQLDSGRDRSADLALDQTEDQQSETDHSDHSGDAFVVLDEQRRERKRPFEHPVAAFARLAVPWSGAGLRRRRLRRGRGCSAGRTSRHFGLPRRSRLGRTTSPGWALPFQGRCPQWCAGRHRRAGPGRSRRCGRSRPRCRDSGGCPARGSAGPDHRGPGRVSCSGRWPPRSPGRKSARRRAAASGPHRTCGAGQDRGVFAHVPAAALLGALAGIALRHVVDLAGLVRAAGRRAPRRARTPWTPGR